VVTLILYAVLAIVLIAAIFLLLTRVLPAGEQIAPVVRDEPIWSLPPEQALDPDDVATVRLPVAMRGYRFAETDQLLDRLADELRERDEEITRLRTRVPPPAGDFAPPGPASPEASVPDPPEASAHGD
jgi:DivIVA domain-containing protein